MLNQRREHSRPHVSYKRPPVDAHKYGNFVLLCPAHSIMASEGSPSDKPPSYEDASSLSKTESAATTDTSFTGFSLERRVSVEGKRVNPLLAGAVTADVSFHALLHCHACLQWTHCMRVHLTAQIEGVEEASHTDRHATVAKRPRHKHV